MVAVVTLPVEVSVTVRVLPAWDQVPFVLIVLVVMVPLSFSRVVIASEKAPFEEATNWSLTISSLYGGFEVSCAVNGSTAPLIVTMFLVPTALEAPSPVESPPQARREIAPIARTNRRM